MNLHTFTSKIKSVSKKSKASLLVAMILAFSMASFAQAANEVQLEGWTKVRNATNGGAYGNSTSAMIDDVVQVEVWHHNMENPVGPKAVNTRVKVNVPNQPGKTQVITGTSAADNSNTVTNSATVNLSLDRAYMEYIPGTAKFKYNKGAQDGNQACQTGFNFPPDNCFAVVTIPDSVVNSQQGVNLDSIRGGPLTGCNAHHETVNIQVRIKAPVVSMNKYVRHQGQGDDAWKTSTNAKAGDNIEYMIRFKNEGNTVLRDVVVADNLPKYNAYVPGSTVIRNMNHPSGIPAGTDNLTKGGIEVGDYAPGSVAYVIFKVKLDPLQAYPKCDTTYDLRNVGIVKPAGMNEYYNTAQVLVRVDCKPSSQDLRCDMLKANVGANRTVTFNAQATATGGAQITAYRYNFGDGTPELLTDKASVSHTYARDGQFVARLTVNGTVNGQSRTVTSDACAVPLTFAPGQPGQPGQPTTLVSTGAGDVAGLFAAVTLAAGLAHRLILGRRLSRQ